MLNKQLYNIMQVKEYDSVLLMETLLPEKKFQRKYQVKVRKFYEIKIIKHWVKRNNRKTIIIIK